MTSKRFLLVSYLAHDSTEANSSIQNFQPAHREWIPSTCLNELQLSWRKPAQSNNNKKIETTPQKMMLKLFARTEYSKSILKVKNKDISLTH